MNHILLSSEVMVHAVFGEKMGGRYDVENLVPSVKHGGGGIMVFPVKDWVL